MGCLFSISKSEAEYIPALNIALCLLNIALCTSIPFIETFRYLSKSLLYIVISSRLYTVHEDNGVALKTCNSRRYTPSKFEWLSLVSFSSLKPKQQVEKVNYIGLCDTYTKVLPVHH